MKETIASHLSREALDGLSDEQIQTIEEFIAYLKWRQQQGNARSWYWADEWRRRFRAARATEQIESGRAGLSCDR
jgi:cytochrome c553